MLFRSRTLSPTIFVFVCAFGSVGCSSCLGFRSIIWIFFYAVGVSDLIHVDVWSSASARTYGFSADPRQAVPFFWFFLDGSALGSSLGLVEPREVLNQKLKFPLQALHPAYSRSKQWRSQERDHSMAKGIHRASKLAAKAIDSSK